MAECFEHPHVRVAVRSDSPLAHLVKHGECRSRLLRLCETTGGGKEWGEGNGEEGGGERVFRERVRGREGEGQNKEGREESGEREWGMRKGGGVTW